MKNKKVGGGGAWLVSPSPRTHTRLWKACATEDPAQCRRDVKTKVDGELTVLCSLCVSRGAHRSFSAECDLRATNKWYRTKLQVVSIIMMWPRLAASAAVRAAARAARRPSLNSGTCYNPQVCLSIPVFPFHSPKIERRTAASFWSLRSTTYFSSIVFVFVVVFPDLCCYQCSRTVVSDSFFMQS